MKAMGKGCALAAIMAVLGTTVQAGGVAAPVMPPEVIVSETTAAPHDWVVPLLLIAVLVAAVSGPGGGGGIAISDARLKTDIKRVGTAAGDLPLYRFRYAGQPTVYEGVMAQDVARLRPDALVSLENGIMAVNYDLLGLKLRQID
ncbi:tail fiber domain-containing protein [Oceaniglobus trochenteri]|uniref:tail fiber domain-containing protein n=1 Tax=Oceaniglobus trochenteri TaxID=2763260 RepID=UPI001CFFF2C9|nr:tail fiber domain-containing protein [Oceaniglobus trochenteri]